MKLNCQQCDKEFQAQRGTAKYCSNTCRQAAFRERKVTPIKEIPSVGDVDIDTKALHCERLLQDPYLKDAFDQIRDAIHEKFAEMDVEEQTYSITSFGVLRLQLKVLDDVWFNLEQVLHKHKAEKLVLQQPTFLGDLNGRESRTN